MLTIDQAQAELGNIIQTIPHRTGRAWTRYSSEANVPNSTLMTWIYKLSLPLVDVFKFRFRVELLEAALLIAIKLDRQMEYSRLIEVKRAFLEVEEWHGLRDEGLMRKAIARVKALLNTLTTEPNPEQQMRLAI